MRDVATRATRGMDLGLFFMPLHHPDKPWAQSLAEDREAILLADRHGYVEAWMGEHLTSKAEPVTSPLMFLATLIGETETMRFGTGVVNLGHRHPLIVAAEAAQFDQLSGGRLMLGVGPGGLVSDAELFGRPDMEERIEVAREALDMIIECWTSDAPIDISGDHWTTTLTESVWPEAGVGTLGRPLQEPHPPIAMALSSPGGRTAEMVAERGFIPLSSNFVPVEFVKAQWESYAAKRDELGLEIDRSIWRVCRNILITESDAEADELLADPDGVFSFYYRYLMGVRRIPQVTTEWADLNSAELNEALRVPRMIEACVIAGSAETVCERLIDVVDELGPFGTLVSVGHDWDDSDRWKHSIAALADVVAPRVNQHMSSVTPNPES